MKEQGFPGLRQTAIPLLLAHALPLPMRMTGARHMCLAVLQEALP